MEIKKVKTAIIGAGAISDVFIQNLTQKFSIIEVCGIASKSGIRAQEKAEQYKIPWLKMEDILEDPSIELAVNLTPPYAHYEVIRDLLKVGKNVYTEKLLTDDLSKAKELVELADARGLTLASSPDTFLGAAIQTARNAVESGMIGRVTSAIAIDNRDMSVFGEVLPWTNTRGGAMGLDLGIYYLTALVSILGGIREVNGMSLISQFPRSHRMMAYGQFGEPLEIAADTLTAGTLLFEKDVVVSLHMNADSIFPEKPLLTIYGTDGILYLPDPNLFDGEVKLLAKGSQEAVSLPRPYGFAENSRGVGAAEEAWALRAGRRPRACKEMAYHCMEGLFGILESAASGKTYHMQSAFQKMPPLSKGYCGTRYLDIEEEGALVN